MSDGCVTTDGQVPPGPRSSITFHSWFPLEGEHYLDIERNIGIRLGRWQTADLPLDDVKLKKGDHGVTVTVKLESSDSNETLGKQSITVSCTNK